MAYVSFIPAIKLIELLQDANAHGNMHVQVLTKNKLVLGLDPLHPTRVIDLSRELILSFSGQEVEAAPSESVTISVPTSGRTSRRSGRYHLDFRGHKIECSSLKQLLAEGLRALENYQRGTLDKLSRVKARTKRIVARDPVGLFEQAELSQRYSEKLIDGWWYGTNNSAPETKKWLKTACSLAGLKWGEDFTASV